MYYYLIKKHYCDFPGGPVVKSLLANGGDTGSIPGGKLRSLKLHGMAKQIKIKKKF